MSVYSIALKMLFGDTTRFLTLVFGLTFSTTLVVQQLSIFSGILRRAGAGIEAIPQADIWVMHPDARYYEARKPIQDTVLQKVQGVAGVEWAQRFYTGGANVQFSDGSYTPVAIEGVEYRSKAGLPLELKPQRPELIERPDAVFFDDMGVAEYSGVKAGDVLQINDHRALVVGLAHGPRSFTSMPTVYTTYERALEYSPGERLRLTYVLVHVKTGYSAADVASEIRRSTGMGALSSSEFFWSSVSFFMKNTGVALNFVATVSLGLLVGIAVAGQTFYSFTNDNIKHFASLKAMGAGRWDLTAMVMLQAGAVALIGWGLGTGIAAIFGFSSSSNSVLAFLLTPQLLAFSAGSSLATVLLASVMSIRRVLSVEAALVFK